MKRDLHLAVILLWVVCLSLTSITSWKVITARKAVLDNVNVNELNLAQALVTYTEGVVRQSSMLLNGLVERLEVEPFNDRQLPRLGRLLDVQRRTMPQLDGVTVYDRQGNWWLSSSSPHPAGLNSADRVYFIHHRDNPSRDLFIGPPIQNRANGAWVVTLSRRIDDAHGQFAGVAAATLGVRNFLDLFGKIDVGENGMISLTYTDGRLLVRYPFREQDMGIDFSGSPVFRQHFIGRSMGAVAYTSSLDGVERLSAFRKSDTLPLIMVVGIGKQEALKAWRFEALLSFGVLVLLMVFTLGAGWVLVRHIRRRIETESQLRVARQQLLDTNRKLEQLAAQDQLTGLANRRCFDEVLALESRRAQRSGTALCLLLMDVDFFKRFNDTYGHVAGDECLQVIGGAIQACVRRPGDLAARYGGEELAIILADTDMQGAQSVAAQVLERLAQANIVHEASPYGRITLSIGIACFVADEVVGQSPSIIEAADSALYKAKLEGRNRVEVFARAL